MAEKIKKNRSWLKILLIVGLAVAVISAIIYWIVATDTFSDTKDRKSAFTIRAADLIHEFETNDSAANKKYREKIITVNGKVSELESPDSTTVNIKMIDTTTGSYAIFAFQDIHLAEARTVKVGDSVSIKGACSGVIYSEALELRYIPFQRCTLNN